MQDSLLTIHEAADKLNVHWQTIRNYIRDGKLPATKFGRNVRISEKDLETFALGEERSTEDPVIQKLQLPPRPTRSALVLNLKEFRSLLFENEFEIIEVTHQEETWFAPEFITSAQEWKIWRNNEEGPLVTYIKQTNKDHGELRIQTKSQPLQTLSIEQGDLPQALRLLSLQPCATFAVKYEKYQKHEDQVVLETIKEVGSAVTITSVNQQQLFTISSQLSIENAPMLTIPFSLLAAESQANFSTIQ